MSSFEIRVALVGYVSVGKSTVLNALLGDKFSETSMRRTTAGINLFKIVSSPGNEMRRRSKRRKNNEQEVVILDHDDAAIVPDQVVSKAESTHKQICTDNEKLRATDQVEEKTFTVEVDEKICDMRSDTQLVVIDVPGINEAECSNKYKNYVTKNWNTFDCVVVVMDAVQGVNTQEQIELLKFVKENNRLKKKLPTIILGNKLDDPEDREKREMVDEARAKVVKIFGESCSEKSLQAILEAVEAGKSCQEQRQRMGSAFIPITALHAFLYKKASGLTFETFQRLDRAIIEKIGVEEVGRMWRKMTKKEKYECIRSAVGDPSAYEERMTSTNFQSFVKTLSYFVGGEENQQRLLQEQMNVQLRLLNDCQESLSDILHSVHHKAVTLGVPVDLARHFWRVYRVYENDAFKKVEQSVDPSCLQKLAFELAKYRDLAILLKLEGEVTKTRQKFQDLVQRQLKMIMTKHVHWDPTFFYSSHCPYDNPGDWKKPDPLAWASLSPYDFKLMMSSALLPAGERYFYESLGLQKVDLTKRLVVLEREHKDTLDKNGANVCCACGHYGYPQCAPYCQNRTLLIIELQRKNKKSQKVAFQLEMPALISNPSHWGYLGWEYCNFCRFLDAKGLYNI